ncbi:MAG: hypothetical protein JXA71_16485 [Chitinispirillaceae bacterium]|nr:hypothetical protein [Chitinispirillaceae bacterium]
MRRFYCFSALAGLLLVPVLSHGQITESEYQAMSGMLLKKYTIEEHRALNERTEQYLKVNVPKPLQRYPQRMFSPSVPQGFKKSASVPAYTRLLVIADQTLYSNTTVKPKIDRYIEDIGRAYACPIVLEVVSGGTPAEIKAIISGYYRTGGLNGAILVGHVTSAFYYIANDHYWWDGGYGPVTFPFDLYYMDLDGQWIDANNDGKFEDHQPGTGDKGPEIFIGRIDPYTMRYFDTEVNLMCSYLDKNHAYWTGGVHLTNTALSYQDHDWASSNIYMNETYPTASVEVLRWTSTNNIVSRTDYLENRLTKDYTIIFMWAHASYRSHSFNVGGGLDVATIYNANPKPVGYNIDGCSAANWSAGNDRFLCGAYVYNKSPTALTLISTTKTGGMLGHRSFYQSLGANKCHGQAFLDWIDNMIKTYNGDYGYVIGWHYGMTIVGDPMITFKNLLVGAVPDSPSRENGGYLLTINGNSFAISFAIAQPSRVSVRIYTTDGKLVHTIADLFHASGTFTLPIDRNRYRAGLYILNLETPVTTVSKTVHWCR